MLEISPKCDRTKIVVFLPKSAIKANCIFHMDIQKENPISDAGNRVL
jgi:hypothetical protein